VTEEVIEAVCLFSVILIFTIRFVMVERELRWMRLRLDLLNSQVNDRREDEQ